MELSFNLVTGYIVFPILLLAQSDFQIDEELSHHCGIAHTRWATHGEPSGVNSHPQRSDTKNGEALCLHGAYYNMLHVTESMKYLFINN